MKAVEGKDIRVLEFAPSTKSSGQRLWKGAVSAWSRILRTAIARVRCWRLSVGPGVSGAITGPFLQDHVFDPNLNAKKEALAPGKVGPEAADAPKRKHSKPLPSADRHEITGRLQAYNHGGRSIQRRNHINIALKSWTAFVAG